MRKHDDVFYCCWEDEERLYHTSIAEAVEFYMDEISEENRPETVEVHKFVRVKCDGVNVSALLDDVIERLDEEYGDPDEPTDHTDAMIDAASKFAAVIEREYVPWCCEKVETVTVNVAEVLSDAD